MSSDVSSICSTAGSPKAAVLPLPVCAWPMMSRPRTITGMASL